MVVCLWLWCFYNIFHQSCAEEECPIKYTSSLDNKRCLNSKDDWELFFNDAFDNPPILDTRLLSVQDNLANKNVTQNDCQKSFFQDLGNIIKVYSEDDGYHIQNYSLKSQCPLGLLYDIMCTYNYQCWSNSKCPVEKFDFICKNNFENLIKSCFNDNEPKIQSEFLKKIHSMSNSNCEDLNLLYQGQTSLAPIHRNTILISCNNVTHDVTLKFMDNSGKTPSNVQCNTSLYDNDTTGVSCYLNDKIVANESLPSDVCNYKRQLESNVIQKTIEFYKLTEMWLFNETNILSGKENQVEHAAEQTYYIAAVYIMGKQYNICGDMWTADSASVFCKEMGKQRKETWSAVDFGKVKSLHNATHYLGGINCTGSESNIIWCDHQGWFDYKGECYYDAVVHCWKVEQLPLLKILLPLIICPGVVIFVVFILYIRKNKKDYAINVQPPNTETTDTESGQFHSTSQFSNVFSNALSSFFQNFVSMPAAECRDSYTNKICGDVVKKLNPGNVCDTVLLYKLSDSDTHVVCKSYMDKDGYITEREFLSQSDHPNIVKYLAEFSPQDVEFNNLPHKMFFMEYLELGSLDNYLEMQGHDLSVADATNIIKGILEGLKFVHEKRFVHGDISSDNFFVFRTDSGLLDVKLGDFGSIYKPGEGNNFSVRSTPRFNSPENLLSMESVDAFSNDIWGLGLVIWEVLSYISCEKNKKYTHNFENYQYNSGCIQMDRFPNNNFGECYRSSHFALYLQLGTHNSREITDKPNKELMREFYNDNYPSISIPFIHPNIDDVFGSEFNDLYGISISEVIKKCLDINPSNRKSISDILDGKNLPTNPHTLQHLGYLGGYNTSSVKTRSLNQPASCYIL